jgi:hypothetical protein
MKQFYLYKITINSFDYYGIAKNINTRKKRHLNDLKKNRHHNIILQRSYNKNNNFIFVVLQSVNTREEAAKLESKYINENECVNMTLGGDGGDTISKHPNRDQIIERIKATRKQMLITPSSEFLKSQGTISRYGDVVWGYYTCIKCGRNIKGKSNFLRYHGKLGEMCGLSTKKHYNNGVIQKFMYEDEPKGPEWVRGKIKKI